MHPIFTDGTALADFALLFLAVVVMPATSVLAGRKLSRAPQSSLIPRYWRTLLRGWLIVAATLGVWIWAGRPFSELGLAWQQSDWSLYGFAALAAVTAFMLYQVIFLPKLITEKQIERVKRQIRTIKIVPRSAAELRVFLLVAITAGVWEELLYRGFLLWFLIPLTGVVAAVAVSSTIFGFGHLYQGWRSVPITGFIGLVLAVAFVLTGSLWLAMAAHALIDIVGGLMSWRASKIIAAREAEAAA